MNEIDKVIAELRIAREQQEQALQTAREMTAAGERELALIDARIWGLERARDLFAEIEPEKTRHDVQGPVMLLFDDIRTHWVEAGIVNETRLPADSVRKFLLRAVRMGKLVSEDGGVYSLPPMARAAE